MISSPIGDSVKIHSTVNPNKVCICLTSDLIMIILIDSLHPISVGRVMYLSIWYKITYNQIRT